MANKNIIMSGVDAQRKKLALAMDEAKVRYIITGVEVVVCGDDPVLTPGRKPEAATFNGGDQIVRDLGRVIDTYPELFDEAVGWRHAAEVLRGLQARQLTSIRSALDTALQDVGQGEGRAALLSAVKDCDKALADLDEQFKLLDPTGGEDFDDIIV